MHFEPEDTGHIGMRFRTIEMDCRTHGISSAETAADMSGFITHIGFPIVQAETRSFSCAWNASGLPYIVTPKHFRLTETQSFGLHFSNANRAYSQLSKGPEITKTSKIWCLISEICDVWTGKSRREDITETEREMLVSPFFLAAQINRTFLSTSSLFQQRFWRTKGSKAQTRTGVGHISHCSSVKFEEWWQKSEKQKKGVANML